jgi:glycosyltransferase involved in cell wall biosynthesis
VSEVVSIITAVHEPSVAYLLDAYKSVTAQRMPEGWSWQWVVQEDGRSEVAAAVLPDDPRISMGTGTKGGPGVARNLALGRAEGALVRVLDADDKLTGDALAREIAILARDESIGWTTASVLDLLPDGSTQGWTHADPAGGRLTTNRVLNYFQDNDYRLPVHPATLCIRRDLAIALGGWMALPGGEDTGLSSPRRQSQTAISSTCLDSSIANTVGRSRAEPAGPTRRNGPLGCA